MYAHILLRTVACDKLKFLSSFSLLASPETLQLPWNVVDGLVKELVIDFLARFVEYIKHA